MKLADFFTWVRVFFAPIFFVLYFLPDWLGRYQGLSVIILLPLLAFAEFTDFLDGYFARKNNEVSDFGKLFDPFADVLLNITIFFCAFYDGYMPIWVLLFIMYREMGMLFVRLMAIKKGVVIGAKIWGKIKTVLYITAGFFSFFLEGATRLGIDLPFSNLHSIGIVLYVLCLIASYVSFGNYIAGFRRIK